MPRKLVMRLGEAAPTALASFVFAPRTPLERLRQERDEERAVELRTTAERGRGVTALDVATKAIGTKHTPEERRKAHDERDAKLIEAMKQAMGREEEPQREE